MRHIRLICILLGLGLVATGLFRLVGPSRQTAREERGVLSVEDKVSAPLPDDSLAIGKAVKRQPIGLVLVLSGFFLILLGIAVHLSITYAGLHTHPGPGIIVPPKEPHGPPLDS